jgi:hypothetical protein
MYAFISRRKKAAGGEKIVIFLWNIEEETSSLIHAYINFAYISSGLNVDH